MRPTLIALLSCAALLAGCAADLPLVRGDHAAQPLAAMLADADRALAAGQPDKAQATLRAACASYPSDKAPWLQLAQMKFDRGNYGEAIEHSLAALQRDASDKQAHSIVAVSGLRLSTHSLAELNQQSNLGGSVRSEAQELARLLRSTLGEEVLVPVAGARTVPRKTAPSGRLVLPSRPAPVHSNSNDPFGALK